MAELEALNLEQHEALLRKHRMGARPSFEALELSLRAEVAALERERAESAMVSPTAFPPTVGILSLVR